VVQAPPQQPTIVKVAEGAKQPVTVKQSVVQAPPQQPTIVKVAEGAKQPVTVKQSVVQAQPQQQTIVKGAEAAFSTEADFGMELSALFAKKK